MESLSPNPILEFNSNQLIEVRKMFGYDDLNRLHQDINILKDWIKKQQHFVIKEYDDKYLERQLILSKGSIERAKKRIDKICTLRGLLPEFLQNFNIKTEFENLLKVTRINIFPKPTPDSYRILYSNFYNLDVNLYEPKDMCRYFILMVEYLVGHDYCAGMEIIWDITNISFGMITKVNAVFMSNTLMIMTDALGLRVKAFHLVHDGLKFVDVVTAVVTRGLPTKIASRLHVHENYESLSKLIPKNILPSDVGGDMPVTLKEITENVFTEFSSPGFTKKIKFLEGAITDESKRLSTHFNEQYSGMPGSFKVLTVD